MKAEYTGKKIVSPLDLDAPKHLYKLQLADGQPVITLTFTRAMIDAPDVLWKGKPTTFFDSQLDQLRDTVKDFILLHYQRSETDNS
jgi:ABC-type arginine transport system ATPase subunit